MERTSPHQISRTRSADDPAYPSSSPRIKLFNASGCYQASAPSGPPGAPTGISVTGINGTGLTAILTGTSVSVSYTEPVLSLPEDLQKTTITHQLGGGPSVFVMDVTATSPAGGGAIVQTFDVPVAPGFRQALTMSVMATNPSGTSSAALASKTVDRTAVSSSGIRR